MSDAPDTDRLFLVLPSELHVLERVVDETEQYVGARVDDEDFAYRVLLLTTEAVTNAIEHGNALDPSKSVRLTLTCRGDVCTIVVEDEGKGFAREAVEDPLGEDALLADGGRGLFLLESMASEVRYEDGGRRVVVILDRAKPPAVS